MSDLFSPSEKSPLLGDGRGGEGGGRVFIPIAGMASQCILGCGSHITFFEDTVFNSQFLLLFFVMLFYSFGCR